jgi:hypothetical protein
VSVPDGAHAGQHLLVGGNGRLYIAGNNRLIVYQLPRESPIAEDSVPVYDKAVNGLNPGIAPTLGPDGTLYFVNGMEVIALNSDLQELWRVVLSASKTSRLTLGQHGRLLYLLSKSDGLVAIQAQTGKDSRVALKDQDVLKQSLTESLHAPIVIAGPDNTEKVYVAGNSANAGVLECFDYPPASQLGYLEGVAPNARWHLAGSGQWGQPIAERVADGREGKASDKSIYAVRVSEGRGTLMAIHWLEGTVRAQGKDFVVGDSPFVLNDGNIAVDGEGNYFTWSTADEGVLITRESSRLSVPLSKARFLFNPVSGTLYLNTVEGRGLSAVIPSYKLEGHQSRTLSSPTHLLVEGKAGGTTSLHADGSLLFGRSFTVPSGVVLRASTGVSPQ